MIFSLGGFNRNLRNELKFAQKIYFWDNGVRNAIVNNFNPLSMRDDRVFSGKISAYEIKWGENAKLKNLDTFTQTYQTEVILVHNKNFREFSRVRF